LRGIVVLEELRGAFELGLREFQLRLSLRLLGLGRLGSEVEGTRFDDEEKVALLDELTVGEIDGFKIAADPCAYLDRFQRLQISGEIAPFLHFFDERLRDGDSWRRRLGLSLRRALPEAPVTIEHGRYGNGEKEKKDPAQ